MFFFWQGFETDCGMCMPLHEIDPRNTVFPLEHVVSRNIVTIDIVRSTYVWYIYVKDTRIEIMRGS